MADKASFLRRFTPPGAPIDTVFEILAVHSAPRGTTTIFDFPEAFRPFDEVDGWDYSKIYVDEESYHEGHGQIYKTFDISEQGCVVIIRPDQYVSYVGPMDDVDAINRFFSGFMLPTSTSNGANGETSVTKPTPTTNGLEMHSNVDGVKAATVTAATAM